MEPFSTIIYFLIDSSYKPKFYRSLTKYLLIQINSPCNVLLLNILLVYGSNDSVLFNIYDTDYVGINPVRRLFLIPYFFILDLRFSQSYRSVNICSLFS